jgi:hypothetical protein
MPECKLTKVESSGKSTKPESNGKLCRVVQVHADKLSKDVQVQAECTEMAARMQVD